MHRLIVAVLLVAACSSPVATVVPAYSLTGTFVLTDSKLASTAASCHGEGGYVDIQAGLDVVVRDQAHTILAAGKLGDGTTTNFETCTFPFTVSGIPKATFYSIEVGHRGELTYSFDEMVAKQWTVTVTLGK